MFFKFTINQMSFFYFFLFKKKILALVFTSNEKTSGTMHLYKKGRSVREIAQGNEREKRWWSTTD